jgi:hypothetical protein
MDPPYALYLFSNVVCVSDFSQATPRFVMGSFQYEEEAEAEGERPLRLF